MTKPSVASTIVIATPVVSAAAVAEAVVSVAVVAAEAVAEVAAGALGSFHGTTTRGAIRNTCRIASA